MKSCIPPAFRSRGEAQLLLKMREGLRIALQFRKRCTNGFFSNIHERPTLSFVRGGERELIVVECTVGISELAMGSPNQCQALKSLLGVTVALIEAQRLGGLWLRQFRPG